MSILVAAENKDFADSVAAAFATYPEINILHAQRLADVPSIIDGHSRFKTYKNNAATPPASQTGIGLAVLDYGITGLNGLKGVAQFANLLPQVPLALVLRGGSLELAQRAYRVGATALIARDLPEQDIAAALRLARDGHFVTLFSQIIHNTAEAAVSDLSERELQVLRGLCDGMQNKEIAHAFAIQEVTVKMHMRAVVRKLGAKNRTHAAMIARDRNLV